MTLIFSFREGLSAFDEANLRRAHGTAQEQESLFSKRAPLAKTRELVLSIVRAIVSVSENAVKSAPDILSTPDICGRHAVAVTLSKLV